MKKRTNRKLWFCVCFLVIIVTTCYSAVMNAQVPINLAMLPQGTLGVTVCDTATNKISVFISIATPAEIAEQVLAHEFVHVRQMSSFKGGCREAQRRFEKEPRFRFDMELEAYCTAQYKMESGARKALYLDGLVWFMWKSYVEKYAFFTFDQMKEYVEHRCVMLGGQHAPP